jgi:hypothetical protein
MKLERITGLIGLLLLLAFLAPYIHKLSQIDITLVLIAGASLAVIDFLTPQR